MNNALGELENLLTDIKDVKVLMYQIEIDFFEQTPNLKSVLCIVNMKHIVLYLEYSPIKLK